MYNKKHLKNLGNSINAIKSIQDVFNNFSDLEATGAIEALKKATQGYSTEVLNLSTSQMILTKEQATAIFTAAGLKDKELELAVSTAITATAQKTATASTLGLSTAFKGLWATLIK